MDDAYLCSRFDSGRGANDRGEMRSANPHAPISDELAYAAWDAGWLWAEGPAYIATGRAKRDLRRATLADIWPKELAA